MKAKREHSRRLGPSQQANPERPEPGVLERLIRELASIAKGQGTDAMLLRASDFELWDGGDCSYLEARLPSNGLPEIDLNASNGQVMIRITWDS